MLRRCRRGTPRAARQPAAQAEIAPAPQQPLEAASRFGGRWQVVKGAWMTEFRDAFERTRGNVELAVALAATMVFAD